MKPVLIAIVILSLIVIIEFWIAINRDGLF